MQIHQITDIIAACNNICVKGKYITHELEIIKGEMPSFGDERFESEENYYFMPISLDNKILAKLLIQFNSKNIKNDLIPFFDTYSFMLRGVLLWFI